MQDYDFGSMFAGMTRATLIPTYRLNLEAPPADRVSFVVVAPTVATLAEWEALATAAAAFIGKDEDEALLTASAARSEYFAEQIVETRTGAKRVEIAAGARSALLAELNRRKPLLYELELMWRNLGTVDAESGKDSAR